MISTISKTVLDSKIKGAQSIDYEALQKIVIGEGKPKKKLDAPEFRLTALSFQSNSAIYDWVMAGSLLKAIEKYNAGGSYSPSSGECWPKDFWLMRIFDAMENLGRKEFEKFVPGVWDSILEIYYDTFSKKIIQQSTKE